MASPRLPTRKFPLVPTIAGVIALICLIAVIVYFARPAPPQTQTSASAEAKAYLPNLSLSDVSMQASENFMKQRVVEITGMIANNGSRAVRSINVYCIFYDVTGHEVHREQLPIVSAAQGLRPGEKRSFRLPFDTLPDGWNQAMPRLVIAQIRFA